MKRLIIILMIILFKSNYLFALGEINPYTIPDTVKGNYLSCKLFFVDVQKKGDEIKYDEQIREICKFNNHHQIIERESYSYNSRKQLSELWSIDKFYYNDQNLLIRTTFLEYGNSGDSSISVSEYKYDSLNNEIEQIDYDEGGSNTYRTYYKYDEIGNIIEQTTKADETNIELPRGFLTYKFDKNHNKIEELYFNNDSSLSHTDQYIYDENMNLIQEIEYDSSGNCNNKFCKKYNENNNLVETKYMNSNSEELSKSVFNYNSEGDLIEIINYNKDGLFNYFKVTKNLEKRIEIYKEFTYFNQNIAKEVRIFDEDGNLIEHAFYDDNDDLFKYYKWEYSK